MHLQAALDQCESWITVEYDPSLGYLPSEDPEHPWDHLFSPEATVEIVGDELVITGQGRYFRIEDLLTDPETSLYVFQARFDVQVLQPDQLEYSRLEASGTRRAFVGLEEINGERSVVLSSGAAPQYPEARMPWDWSSATTYTVLVNRDDAAYLLLDGSSALTLDYDELAPHVGAPGLYSFSSGLAQSTFERVEYCICRPSAPPPGEFCGRTIEGAEPNPPIHSPEDIFVVENLHDEPDLSTQPVTTSNLSFDLIIKSPEQPSSDVKKVHAKVTFTASIPARGFVASSRTCSSQMWARTT